MEQDWKPVVFVKKPNQEKKKPSTNKHQPGKKINIGDKLRKLDNTEIDKISSVKLSTSRAISKRRTELKLSQKQLAQKINEKIEVISQYETGKAIPKQHILIKLERILGIYLTGSKIGEIKSRQRKK